MPIKRAPRTEQGRQLNPAPGQPPLPPGISAIEIRRSARRRRTVSARIESDVIVVLMPATLTQAEERAWVDRMVTRLAAKRSRPHRSDDDLGERAVEIAQRHLDGPAGRPLRPTSVRWSTTMNHRWGSCSTDSGAIRLSHRLARMPDYVLDYVLAHELVHLVHPTHGRGFKELLACYPLAERAEGFLAGWVAAASGSDDPGWTGIDGSDD